MSANNTVLNLLAFGPNYPEREKKEREGEAREGKGKERSEVRGSKRQERDRDGKGRNLCTSETDECL